MPSVKQGAKLGVGMWNCLLIEDDKENARYLVNGLSELGYTVMVSHDGVQGLDNAMKDIWDVIILDRMLPDSVDGLSILFTLRALGKKVPVLVLSALSGVDDKVDGLKAGGDDYLIKPFSFQELAARLQALIRRSQDMTELKNLQVADLVMNVASQKVTRAEQILDLQPREIKLLAYLMMNSHKIVTRTMLLEVVWGYSFDPQSNVIDVLVSRLRRKIAREGARDLLHTVRGRGYVLTDKDTVDGVTIKHSDD